MSFCEVIERDISKEYFGEGWEGLPHNKHKRHSVQLKLNCFFFFFPPFSTAFISAVWIACPELSFCEKPETQSEKLIFFISLVSWWHLRDSHTFLWNASLVCIIDSLDTVSVGPCSFRWKLLSGAGIQKTSWRLGTRLPWVLCIASAFRGPIERVH